MGSRSIGIAKPVSAAPGVMPSYGVIQCKCSCGGNAGLTGECEECQRKRLGGQTIQPKLQINVSGDRFEQEADRVADQVTRGPNFPAVRQNRLPISRLQRRAAHDIGGADVPKGVYETVQSSGQPLDHHTLEFMESRFGHDFSKVRVHHDRKAAASAQSVNARAYTLGSHVVFGPGEYAPNHSTGRHLLAHELTHTIQQGQGKAAHSLQRQQRSAPCPSRQEAIEFLQAFDARAQVEEAMDRQINLAGQGTPGTINATTIQTADQAIRAVFGSLLPGGRAYTDPNSVDIQSSAQFANVRVPTDAVARRRIARVAMEVVEEDLEITCTNRLDHPVLLSEIVEPILRARTIQFVRDYEVAKRGGQTRFPQVQGQTRPHVDLPDSVRNSGHVVVHEGLHFYVSDRYRETAEAQPPFFRQVLMEGGAEFLARHVIREQLSQDPAFAINFSTYAEEFRALAELLIHRGGLSSFVLAYFQGRVDILGLRAPGSQPQQGATNSSPYKRFSSNVSRQSGQTGGQGGSASPLQVTSNCGCSPPPTASCTSIVDGEGTRQDTVLAAFQTAAGWLPGAQSAMQEYVDASESERPNKAAAAPLRAHFNWPPSGSRPLRSTPEMVLGVINRMFQHITHPVCPNCQEECPCGDGDPWACVPGAWHDSNCIEFCDPFFSNQSMQPHVIVHEMMHAWEDKGDISYENEGSPNYPPNVLLAQENADSYAALIRDLG